MSRAAGGRRVAVLVTCFRQRPQVMRCLEALSLAAVEAGIDPEIHLLDDDGRDGTREAVMRSFPGARITVGDGSHYWNGGMRRLWLQAAEVGYDDYLWLNSDTYLLPSALRHLLESAAWVREREGRDGIVVGAVRDPESGEISYGGVSRTHPHRPLSFGRVEPGEEPRRCDTFNGNCLLVPDAVVREIGVLSPEFSHAIGDTDYGLRAGKAGFGSWVCPHPVGSCRLNLGNGDWARATVPLRRRIRLVLAPKGLPPREWWVFVRRHTGRGWLWYWVKPYLRVLFPELWSRLTEASRSFRVARVFRAIRRGG
ncbi:MAG: glycosyltransferase family 2 protein [Magnetococcales bacterium]|nr:glycosyltransferase family 2 protein [Magnetococcales bacterium]MBF0156760.1 glycosyltransferase family 2 protein [Magnetococcales bacterium]